MFKEIIDGAWQALVHTPVWVYIIFFYCLFVGIKGVKGGVVPFVKVLIIPVVFLYLSLDTVLNNFRVSDFVVYTYVGSLLVGALLGWLQAHSIGLEVDREKWLIKLPGTWVTLVVVMIIFFSKYYFGYEIAADPKLLSNSHFEFAMLAVSGLTAGMFVGRGLYYFRCFRTKTSIELSED